MGALNVKRILCLFNRENLNQISKAQRTQCDKMREKYYLINNLLRKIKSESFSQTSVPHKCDY